MDKISVAVCRFRLPGSEEWIGGFWVNHNLEYAYIICGCCGRVYDIKDVEEYEFCGEWPDFLSCEITGWIKVCCDDESEL